MRAVGGQLVGDGSALVDLRAYPVDAVLALNNAHSIETSELDPATYARLVAAAGFAVAAGDGRDAFLIAYSDAAVHDNNHLAWFRERHDSFYYVDRIIVAEHARGRGLARALYEALFAQARAEGRTAIGCEINVDPPNPASDALHAALGFVEIGQRTLGAGKIIRYMRLDLALTPA